MNTKFWSRISRKES